jgi:ActR/RegA family two-component response regulator
MTPKVALLVTDLAPSRDLTESLAAKGYYLEFAYSIEAGLERVQVRAPTLAVVGPIERREGALDLLATLARLRIHSLVLSEEPELVHAAERLGMQVRPR